MRKKGRKKSRGDLWIACQDINYWFEFKRSAYSPKATKWGLHHSLEIAIVAVNELYFAKDEIGVAGVIAATYNMKPGYQEIYKKFAKTVDFAFQFGPDDCRGAYLFFKLLDKKTNGQAKRQGK
jgi:hypothetical protein